MYQFLCRRRSAVAKFFIFAVFGIVLYNEWFIYSVQPIYWLDMECPKDDISCTKIMFIADPQIQGEMDVAPPLSYLFNWDSDRYLKSTFREALKYFKPNVLVYLGDLMDEGSISSMVQFHAYVRRLSDIFEVSYPVIQVWLPGDNDIGGENEPIRKDKLEEFHAVFDQPSVITYKNVSFYKVNGITHSYPQASEDDNGYRIVVSHYPVLWRSVFGKQVHDAIRPNVYFCAHEHKSKYVVKDRDWRNIAARPITSHDSVMEVASGGENVYEIYVPTCSYRMGTSTIGYGAAILVNNNNMLRYGVLWSPLRFTALFAYAILAVCSMPPTFSGGLTR
ncbi:unnamed protein product, partial [Iphiclides podalirius]